MQSQTSGNKISSNAPFQEGLLDSEDDETQNGQEIETPASDRVKVDE